MMGLRAETEIKTELKKPTDGDCSGIWCLRRYRTPRPTARLGNGERPTVKLTQNPLKKAYSEKK